MRERNALMALQRVMSWDVAPNHNPTPGGSYSVAVSTQDFES